MTESGRQVIEAWGTIEAWGQVTYEDEAVAESGDSSSIGLSLRGRSPYNEEAVGVCWVDSECLTCPDTSPSN